MKTFATVGVAVLCLALPPSPVNAQTTDTARVSFDFQDTDIRMVITAMAEAGGMNVVFAGLQPQPITLRTSQPVARTAVRALLRNLVESSGFRWAEDNGLVHIFDAGQAPAPPPSTLPVAPPQAPQEELQLFVYRLKHSQAQRLAGSLQSLFGGSAGAALTTGGATSLSEQLRQQRIPPGFPAQPPAQPAARPAANVGGAQTGANLQIVADELTNSLLVRTRPSDWPALRQAIDTLDIRPLQVLIEATIVEVRRSSNFNLNLASAIGMQEVGQTGTEAGGELGRPATGDLILRLLGLGQVSADLVISAVSANADVKILSRPLLLAQNNHEARILIGSQRPFIQVVRALPTESAVRDQIVQYRDVGTSLTILPTISTDGFVSLQVLQEVSSATSETQFGAPVISTREASTRLLMRDGQTAVIAGLIDQQEDRSRSGIPLLKDLPVLGMLFGSTRKNRSQSELFLFLTPHVVRTDEDVDRLRGALEDATELRGRLPPLNVVSPDTTGR